MEPAVGTNQLCVVRPCLRLWAWRYGEILALAMPDESHSVLRSHISQPGDYVGSRNAQDDHTHAGLMLIFPAGCI